MRRFVPLNYRLRDPDFEPKSPLCPALTVELPSEPGAELNRRPGPLDAGWLRLKVLRGRLLI